MSRERSVKGRSKFNEDWLQNGEFKLWVAKSTTEHEFRCFLCKKSNTLGNMSIKALRSHAELVALKMQSLRSEEHVEDVKS